MKYKIREIESKDNKVVENIIRTCLIEFGANHEGTAWADPDLGRFSEIYNKDGCKYWVVENEEGIVVGGVGIGKLTEDVCELQKMYFLQEFRGTGLAHKLMEIALDYAKKYYKRCYIETLGNMIAANKFYKKYGFISLDKPLLHTEHNACDVWYVKELYMKIEVPSIKEYEIINEIAKQVHELHVKWRPDLFISVEKPITKERFESMIQAKEIYIAKIDNEIVGYVTFNIEERTNHGMRYRKQLEIDAIGVDKKNRGKGIGTNLLTYVKEIANENRCTDIYLTVNEENVGAIKLYEKFGFKLKNIAYSMQLEKE